MTAPDIDVRPGRSRAAVSAGPPGFSRLARLLLFVARPLAKLDQRFVLLLFAASLSPACIIPVGPDFQDPPGIPNGRPVITNTDPLFGTEVLATDVPMEAMFEITVIDSNNDPLYVRWVADFPPLTHETRTFDGPALP